MAFLIFEYTFCKIEDRIGDSCSRNEDCRNAVGNSKCDVGRCTCSPAYDVMDGGTRCVRRKLESFHFTIRENRQGNMIRIVS